MENNDSKSLERSKKTFITISKIFAKAACSIVGQGLTFDAFITLTEHLRQLYKDRTEKRIHEFHQHLLGEEICEIKQHEFLDKPIELEDYNSLLSSAIQDDEDKKVQLYANLLRGLASGKIPSEVKRYIIKAAKAITFEEAELIRKFYIYKKFAVIPETGPTMHASSLLKSKNFMEQIMIQNLVRLGILLETSPEHFEPTQLMSFAVEGFYEKETLEPSAINKLAWSGINVMIVSYQLDIHSSIAIKIGKILRKYRINSTIAILNDNQVKMANIFHHGFIFLLDSSKVPDYLKNVVAKLSSPKVILKLLLKNSDGTVPKDDFPELIANEVLPIDFNLNDADISLLEDVIQRYVEP